MAEPRVIHFEIVGKDQRALQSYYSQVLGWKLNTDFPGGYGMTSPEQTGSVVGVGSSQDGSAGHVTGYVTVDDIDAMMARATKLGGTVIMPKFSPGPQHAAGRPVGRSARGRIRSGRPGFGP